MLIVDSGATQPRGRLCTDPVQVRIRNALAFSSTIGPFKYSRQTSSIFDGAPNSSRHRSRHKRPSSSVPAKCAAALDQAQRSGRLQSFARTGFSSIYRKKLASPAESASHSESNLGVQFTGPERKYRVKPRGFFVPSLPSSTQGRFRYFKFKYR